MFQIYNVLSQTNSSPLKTNGWKIAFPFLGWSIFRGYVRFREGSSSKYLFVVCFVGRLMQTGTHDLTRGWLRDVVSTSR